MLVATLTNETKDKYTFFDNLVVQHYTGPLVEENVYYPFGLKAVGISSKAAGRLENKKKYNGYEENKTFDLNWYETFYRTHDPQLGRFWQIDPRPTDFESPYAAMGNNPISRMDILGDSAGPKIAPIFIPQEQMPNVYQNHLNYIKKHPNEAIPLGGLIFLIFDYEPDKEKHITNRTENEKANRVNNKDATKQEDEVAPACTKQGGARGVRMAVPTKENAAHGGQLGAAVKYLKMKDGDKFLVMLIPQKVRPTSTPQTVPEAKVSFEGAKKAAQQQSEKNRPGTIMRGLNWAGAALQAAFNVIFAESTRFSERPDEDRYN